MKKYQAGSVYKGSFERRPVEPALERDLSRTMERNMKQVDADFDELERTTIAGMELAAKVDTNVLNDISKFSKTAAKGLELYGNYLKKKTVEEKEAEYYANGVPPNLLAQYDANEDTLKETDDVTTELSNEMVAKGVPYEQARSLKGLNHWEKIGAVTGLARRAGEDFQVYLQENLRTNNTLQIPDGHGGTFTPMDVGNDPVRAAMAAEAIRKQQMRQYGLTGQHPGLLNKYLYPYQRDAINKEMAVVRRNNRIDKSEEQVSAAIRDFRNDGNINRFFARVRGTVDEMDNLRGNRGAWKLFNNMIIAAADAGQEVPDFGPGSAIWNAPYPPNPKRTFGQQFEYQLLNLQNEVAAHAVQNWDETEALRRMRFQQEERTVLEEAEALAQQGQLTEAALNGFQRRLRGFGYVSNKLNNLYSNETISAREKQAMRDRLENLRQRGILMPQDIPDNAPISVVREFAEFANKNAASMGKPDLVKETIRDHIQNTPQVRSNPHGRLSGLLAPLVADLQEKALSDYRIVYANTEGTDAERHDAAMKAAFEGHIKRFDHTNANSRYYISEDGALQYYKDTKGESAQYHAARILETTKAIKDAGGGAKAFDTVPILSAAQKAAIVRDYGTSMFEIPPEVHYWSQATGVHPMEIIDRQVGRTLQPNPSSIHFRQTLTPDGYRTAQRYPTHHRSQRGLGSNSTGTFFPERVPMGYGSVVQDAATEYDIPPAILAGLLDQESAYRPDVIDGITDSKAGAQGIAQFMPKTAQQMGINPLNPVEAIHGAAKYLRHLMDRYGYSLDTAIYAYNAGPGTISKYGIGATEENANYYPGVMKNASKYGHPGVWENKATMRGSFAK